MHSINHILLLLIILVYPVNCAGTTNQTTVLIDGDGYVLANNEQRTFYQGYAIVIKGVGTKGDKAWIELLQNGTTVSYGIFKANDHLIYAKDHEIFNMSIDHIYVGSEKDLVFFYVHQYLDPDLPAPVSVPAPVLNASIQNATIIPSVVQGQDSSPVPGYGACVAIGMVMLSYLRLLKKDHSTHPS
ncbi:hypothetical protein DRN77_02960 [Methanosarcinales archaeon]|nr:MAG: hypothetical protein DRN77_02960 [Methanosarcinales archaeon]